MSAALHPLSDEELSSEARAFFDDVAASYPDGRVPGFYRIVAHCPQLLAPLRQLAGALFHATGLDPELRELVVLRTVWLERCEHTWAQHLVMSSAIGLDRRRIDDVRDWHGSSNFNQHERVALELVDSIVAGTGGPPVAEHAIAELGPAATVAVELLATFFVLVARVVNHAELMPSSPVVDWPREASSSD